MAVQELAAAQRRLYHAKENQGLSIWLAYQGYPITLLTYSAMLGASICKRPDRIASLLINELESSKHKTQLAVEIVPPFCLLGKVCITRPRAALRCDDSGIDLQGV